MQQITPQLTVADQLTPEAIEQAVAEGYRVIINNRPDGEEAGQPTAAACAKRAAALGATYHHIPSPTNCLDAAAVDAFNRAVRDADEPVLAHCRTGKRSLSLWLAGQIERGALTLADARAQADTLGFSVEGLEAWHEQAAASRSPHPIVDGFYDPRTFSVQYVVTDPNTKRCAIIDPVLDYDEKSGATATYSADAILAHIDKHQLQPEWILDTHPHADHFSAAAYLHERTGAPTGIGEHVVDVQALWKDFYGLSDDVVPGDGSQWTHLFTEGERFTIGDLEGSILFSPGHTLASITYVIGDAAFVHDTLFTPDFGTARADFPGGSSAQLWRSIQDILSLPDETRLYVGHDYMPNGRAPRWATSVREQKTSNPHVVGMDEAAYVAMRNSRDRQLSMPKLILHALQVNIRGGRLPEPDPDGRRRLILPLDVLGGSAWDDAG